MADDDPTGRMASNTPLSVDDERMMDEGISDQLELLCHIRKTPNVLYGFFVELTRQFYRDSDSLPIDVCMTWDPDTEKTKIWIDTEYMWEDTTPEFRPAIYVKLGPIAYKSLHGRNDGKTAMDLEQGEYHFSRNGTGTVSWVHIGSQSGEAVVLAGATLDYFDGVSKLIQEEFGFQTFAVTGVSPLSQEKESKERFRSTVTATFTFQDTWSIKRESPKLKRLVFQAGQSLLSSVIMT